MYLIAYLINFRLREGLQKNETFGNLCVDRVSVSVSKIWISKSLTIGPQRFGLKKSLCNSLEIVLVFYIFQDRKCECNLLLLKF